MAQKCLSRLAAKESVVQIPWIGRMTNTIQLLLRGKILKTAIVLQVAYALKSDSFPSSARFTAAISGLSGLISASQTLLSNDGGYAVRREHR